MHLKTLQARLRDFAAARDWQAFHSPKNLAMALMVEAAELLELFQWLTTAQSHTFTKDPHDKERVGDEMADVLLYLLQLADHTGVDLAEAVEAKLRKNAVKHPAKHPPGPAPGPKGHLLVDWENVQPRGEELRALVPEGSDVWLFHGPQQKVDKSSHLLAFGMDKVTLVPRTGKGKNALDFQLSYYIGYISASQPQERFVVVSNDSGYDPMLEHARELGFDARRCGFRRSPAQPAIFPPKPEAASSVKAKPRPACPPPAPPTAMHLAAPFVEPSAAQIAWRAIVHLRKMPVHSRPVQQGDWQACMEALIPEQVADKGALAQHASQLVQGRRLGLAKAREDIGIAGKEPKPVLEPVAKKIAVAAAAARLPAAVKQKSATVSKTALVSHTAKKLPAPAVAKKMKKSAVQPVPTASKKASAVPTALQIAQQVLASLKKMPDNKPTRTSALLKMIKSQAGAASGDDATAAQVLSLLQARGTVVQTGNALVYRLPSAAPKAKAQ